MINPRNVLKERLRPARKAVRLSIENVSDMSGYSKSYIQQLELGYKDNPTIQAIWDLAQVLKVKPAYLLGLEN